MTRVLLLDVRDDEERRAALLEDGALSLLWVERADERSLVGDVYLGRVVRVEPSIGAAFVDLGLDRPGFLPADDAVLGLAAEEEANGAPAAGDAPPPDHAPAAPPARIEDVVRTGDAVVVQVARDAVGRKGPTLTRHVSFAGRTLVVLPRLGRVAVSRKIDDAAARRGVEERVKALGAPPGTGIVARTAAAAAGDEEMREELARLLGVARAVEEGAAAQRAPALLHAEDDFVSRAVRELSVRAPEGAAGPLRIVVDAPDALARVREMTRRMDPVPETAEHDGPVPIFHSFGVEKAVRALDGARVALPGGASIVIHETEAMWTIDVNSGRLRGGESLEETALATDLLAAREVARQIRLRDLSGLIVVDFIDCREPANRARVEESLRAELAKDPARMRVAPLSEFMVAEITRRRLRSGAARAGAHVCPSCAGRGRVRTAAAAALAAVRDVRAAAAAGSGGTVEVVAAPSVVAELERRRPALAAVEARHGARVVVRTAPGPDGDRFDVRRA